MDFLDLAIAKAGIRLHFDEFGDLGIIVQDYTQAKNLLFVH
jgi:hypothetical protein